MKVYIFCSLELTVWLLGAVIHEPVGPTPHSQFEHSSIPATVKKLFNLKSNFLTKRDAWAGTFENYFKLRDSPRTDCPGLLSSPQNRKPKQDTGCCLLDCLLLCNLFIETFFTCYQKGQFVL